MLDSYRAALRTPGAAPFCGAGLIMRLPIAMYPLALVLLISTRTGHYGFAGLLSGSYVAGTAVGSPLLARVVDRHGQTPVLLPATAVHVLAVAAIAVLVGRTPEPALLAPAFVAGASFLSVGSLVRARWSAVLAGRPELSAAYSLESTLDEVVFVLGPLLATVLATQVDGVAPLVLAIALVASGALWLRTLTASAPPPRPPGPVPSALRTPAVAWVTGVMVAIGAVFATVEISMVAFCGQHGRQGAGGVVLACFAFGSGLAGFFYGARHWRAPVLRRLGLQGGMFALLPVVLLAAWDVPSLAVCAVLAGLAIAPALIAGFGVIEQYAEGGTLTEALAWLNTGLGVGYGLGSSVVGRVADVHGARAGFVLGTVASVAVALLAASTVRALQRAGHWSGAALP